ncbi:uncharacterized protein LOC120574786 isoform X1 [Perca fluviatilis]|uniref:uncharacterized protein LOC120574786 isoform X1 n=1 Tax=Perca fluviatilis TaxID=8168 RepID=UPI0019667841|nr:uncharacterized protein LOC120574786 isoform X1 [Perca fluviatilis]
MMTRSVVFVLLAVLGQASGQVDPNIARGGNVTQSSLYANGVPERAIDGNRASNWAQGSCTHTNNDLKPWWRLDLLKTYRINTVTITNRGDCCPERISGAEIRIGDSLNDKGNGNPRCTVISSMAAATSQIFGCNGMEGRYVNIVIPGRQEYLTLCEVEVNGQPKALNIALTGNVIQSSLYANGVPERAIDGNRASNWAQGSCTHTNNDLKPWWRLDLLKTFQINTVTITNRGDCCPERINGAEIRIGDSLNDNGNGNPRCTVISSMATGTSQTFVCNGMEGRYVNIVIPGRQEYLTLCEVEVTGQPKGYAATTALNIAQTGNVIQSSLYANGVPERAIDGNRASNWAQGSCTHTNNDLKPWWRLDLLKTYQINTVTITNRGDCCPERINGAEIRIGDSLNDNGNGNPRCTVISSMAAGTSQTFVCNGMEGRYVNIVIPGRQEYLTLCEVEVTGRPKALNIAQTGNVIQSSLYGNAIPARAIDGNRASVFGQGSCSVTNNDLKPWWRLDLLKTYEINTVTITNRGDCCPERISGAEIRIGDSLSDNGNGNPRCTVISSMAAGTSQTFVCNGMEGRYVNIVIPGRQEYLTLCEVEVTGQPKALNIAQTGNVIQSSLYGNAIPERAIDGNRASVFGQGSCSVTNNDLKPWWRLDLLKTYQITTVTITNRGDCCPERINGAEIRIGDSLNDNGNGNPRCTVISSLAAGTSQTFVCNGMEGRYVNIVIPGREEYLTLCEVEVTGSLN